MKQLFSRKFGSLALIGMLALGFYGGWATHQLTVSFGSTRTNSLFVVTVSPESASVHLLQAITLTSTAGGGTPPYLYQWYLNESPVSGATSDNWTLALEPSGNYSIGTYSVYLEVIDSLEESSTSNHANITVLSLFGDLNNDGRVDMKDVGIDAKAFGTVPGDSRWNPVCDVNGDGKVDSGDVAAVAKHFGQRYLPSGARALSSLYLGWRSSEYGHQGDKPSSYWISTAASIASKIPNGNASGVWVIGEIEGQAAGTATYLSFPSNRSVANVDFASVDYNEEYLKAFDLNHTKVWLEVEPADADILTLIDLVLGRYKSHSCVIGFGIDVEWYRPSHYINGEPVTDAEAQTWLDRVKSYGDYKLFLKHWLTEKLPSEPLKDLVCVCDSEGFNGLYEMVGEFKLWGEHFSGSDVFFQVGYPDDRVWWSKLSDPARIIAASLVGNVKNCRGVYWVDFTITDLYP